MSACIDHAVDRRGWADGSDAAEGFIVHPPLRLPQETLRLFSLSAFPSLASRSAFVSSSYSSYSSSSSSLFRLARLPSFSPAPFINQLLFIIHILRDFIQRYFQIFGHLVAFFKRIPLPYLLGLSLNHQLLPITEIFTII